MKTRIINWILIIAMLPIQSACAKVDFEKKTADYTTLEIETRYLEKIVVHDPEKIQLLKSFINKNTDGWWQPFPETPIPQTTLTLFDSERDDAVAIGISPEFITRTGTTDEGNYVFLFQRKSRKELQELTEGIHQGLYESIYTIVPDEDYADKRKDYWKEKLKELQPGDSFSKVLEFIKNNGLSVSYANFSALSLDLEVINQGDHVNTILKAQIRFDKLLLVQDIRFSGIEISKKLSIQDKAEIERRIQKILASSSHE